jgi:hypothetical protein
MRLEERLRNASVALYAAACFLPVTHEPNPLTPFGIGMGAEKLFEGFVGFSLLGAGFSCCATAQTIWLANPTGRGANSGIPCPKARPARSPTQRLWVAPA